MYGALSAVTILSSKSHCRSFSSIDDNRLQQGQYIVARSAILTRTFESRSMNRISCAFLGRPMPPFTTLASHESGTALRTEREAVYTVPPTSSETGVVLLSSLHTRLPVNTIVLSLT